MSRLSMSEFQKSFAKSKLATLPVFNECDETDEEEQDDNFELQLKQVVTAREEDTLSESSLSSNKTVKPAQAPELSIRPKGFVKKAHLTPITWTTYFEREIYIDFETESLQICCHAYVTPPIGDAPLFVMHHGAGSSGLSFAQLSLEIRKILPSAGFLSIDARYHGFTQIIPTQEAIDLSLDVLSQDLISAIAETKKSLNLPETTPLILVGHSLGGAVVTSIAKSGKLGENLLCYAVIDVVEGSAMDALKSMQAYLYSRPVSFKTLESAIKWHVRTRTIRNLSSAQISVPALLKQNENSDLWTWRTDLSATQPFWENWFVGMSKNFLEGRAGKLLMLAGTDRLDTELMIGQMQGKFALQIFPEAGHFIHEDLPEKAALMIVDLYNRNDRSAMVLPPKVADMIRDGRKI